MKHVIDTATGPVPAVLFRLDQPETLETIRNQIIETTLAATAGNIAACARILKLKRPTLAMYIHKHLFTVLEKYRNAQHGGRPWRLYDLVRTPPPSDSL